MKNIHQVNVICCPACKLPAMAAAHPDDKGPVPSVNPFCPSCYRFGIENFVQSTVTDEEEILQAAYGKGVARA